MFYISGTFVLIRRIYMFSNHTTSTCHTTTGVTYMKHKTDYKSCSIYIVILSTYNITTSFPLHKCVRIDPISVCSMYHWVGTVPYDAAKGGSSLGWLCLVTINGIMANQ